MKAYLRSVRIAPKKANLIARMVRGMPVPAAVIALQHTNKKAARIVEKLLLSAMANASHNEKQDPEQMVIASIVVNQGQAYRRGMPKARGQTRPFRKFLSHIELVLGYPSEGKSPRIPKSPRKDKNEGSASQDAKKPVKQVRSAKEKKNTKSSDSSISSVSSASSAS
ncbi:MAG: 50S ribosomal protein L22 [Candidatus Peribacteraceae bacterium]